MRFLVELTLRYTRISCMPFRATIELSRVVEAENQADALRQACLCVDRDLEEMLASVNTINLNKVHVEVQTVKELHGSEGQDIWNPAQFEPQVEVPRYIVISEG